MNHATLSFKDENGTLVSLPIVDSVVLKLILRLITRSNMGIQKYGTTLHENKKDDFFKHFLEEMLDGALYAEKLTNESSV